MHLVQQRLLELAKTTNLASLKLRELGNLVGEPHPQKIKHHLNQLLKKGFLKQSHDKTVITLISSTNNQNDLFISLPILGSANCGQALAIAEEYHEGYLQLSKSLLPFYKYRSGEYFVVRAIGNSMNNAKINDKELEDGDYAIVDKKQKELFFYNNKYVLSIIAGMANIKKLKIDSRNSQIILISESLQDYPPIYIHNDDFDDYLINGEVIDVIKKPVL